MKHLVSISLSRRGLRRSPETHCVPEKLPVIDPGTEREEVAFASLHPHHPAAKVHDRHHQRAGQNQRWHFLEVHVGGLRDHLHRAVGRWVPQNVFLSGKPVAFGFVLVFTVQALKLMEVVLEAF